MSPSRRLEGAVRLEGSPTPPSVGREALQLIDALRVLLGPVVPDTFRALPIRPLVHRRSVPLERHERDPVPTESAIRLTSVTMIERTPTPVPPGNRRARPLKDGSSVRTARPLPCRRTMRGAPAKAQNMTTIRPFSRRWAMVSTPLPVWSRYATVRSSTTTNSSRLPLGEQFTRPSPERGAVATKKTGCAVSHSERA